MAIRTIRVMGDNVLTKVCRPVEEMTPRIQQLIDDMLDTMYEAMGVGLAAPQVGVLRRVVIVDTGEGPIELINPEIVATVGSREVLEGCLSCPGKWGYTIRPEAVTLKALDRTGKERTYTADGLKAQAFCHECDHLEGVLFLDKVVRMADPEEIESR